jgi:beta-phosphoglucomutase
MPDMMPAWPRVVLFDFDGVIVNSEPLHFLAYHGVLADHDIELTEAEYYDELLGLNDRDAVRRIFALRQRMLEPRVNLAILARKSRAMMDLIEQRRLGALPGAEALIRGLWRNYPLAICSGAVRDEIDAMLLGVSLRDCFDVIVAAEDVAVGKPDPAGYLRTLELLGEKHRKKFTPADALVVEDAPAVVRSMRQAGFTVLAITSSYPADRFPEANYVASSLEPAGILKQVPGLKITV